MAIGRESATRCLLTVVIALSGHGCSCGSGIATPDASSHDAGSRDTGVFFDGLDASDYERADTGTHAAEPCAVPMRRARFPISDASLGWTNRVWGDRTRVWVYLGGYPGGGSPPESAHLFDLETERELDIEFALEEGERLDGVFPTPGGYELVVRIGDGGPWRVVHVDRDGQYTGADDEPLALSANPSVRLDDGRYVAALPASSLASLAAARLQLSVPGGVVEVVDLGFDTRRGHVIELDRVGDTIVGIGYEDEATRVVSFEFDSGSGSVRRRTLIEDVFISNVGSTGNLLAGSGEVVTAAFVHRPAADSSVYTAELFWWSLGSDSVRRQVVRPPSALHVLVLALGGEMPLQTLVLGQSSGATTWVTAARVRAPEELVGGSEPLAVLTGLSGAAAWQPSEGTAALALLGQRELETLYVCERAP